MRYASKNIGAVARTLTKGHNATAATLLLLRERSTSSRVTTCMFGVHEISRMEIQNPDFLTAIVGDRTTLRPLVGRLTSTRPRGRPYKRSRAVRNAEAQHECRVRGVRGLATCHHGDCDPTGTPGCSKRARPSAVKAVLGCLGCLGSRCAGPRADREE